MLKCWKLSMRALISLSVLANVLGVSGIDCKEEEKNLFEFTKPNHAFHKHIRAHTNLLEIYGK